MRLKEQIAASRNSVLRSSPGVPAHSRTTASGVWESLWLFSGPFITRTRHMTGLKFDAGLRGPRTQLWLVIIIAD